MNTTTNNTVISADTSNKAIKARCRNIRQSAKKFNDYVHETGLMVMRHTMAFGDCTGAAWLMDALPKSVKREALQQWFETFSPIAVHLDKDGNMKAHLRKPESKKFNDWNIAGAEAKPWFEMDKALKEDPALLGFEAFMLDFSKYVERMENKAKDEKTTKPEDSATILSFASYLRQAKMDFSRDMADNNANLGDWSVPAGQTGSDTNVVAGPSPAKSAKAA